MFILFFLTGFNKEKTNPVCGEIHCVHCNLLIRTMNPMTRRDRIMCIPCMKSCTDSDLEKTFKFQKIELLRFFVILLLECYSCKVSFYLYN